jgi:hypothetical protein
MKFTTSCKKPSGQIDEQYTLPKSIVNKMTRIKPVVINEKRVNDFKSDGTNWKKIIPLIADSWIKPVKSISTNVVGIIKIIDNTILIFRNKDVFIRQWP